MNKKETIKPCIDYLDHEKKKFKEKKREFDDSFNGLNKTISEFQETLNDIVTTSQGHKKEDDR